MLQLILHGIGDYFIQSDKWALNKKKKGWFDFQCCFIHCLTYSLPFLFIGSWLAVLAIFVSHFIIDRTNIVAYALAIKNNVRKDGIEQNGVPAGYKVTLFYTGIYKYDISNFGFGKDRPFAITIWLYIICDNLCHIICNYISLTYL